MWVINSTKTILSSEINIHLVTKLFHCKLLVKKVLIGFKIFATRGLCLRTGSELKKWFGLGDGENISQRRLYNGVSLWFMVNNYIV